MGEFNGVRVEGIREARKRLRESENGLAQMRDLHRSIAKDLANLAKARAPVGESRKLRKSVRGAGTKTQAIVRMGSKKVPYAHAIHWGRNMWPSQTAAPKPPRRAFWAKIPRRAFIYDTVKDHAYSVEKRYQDFINEILNQQ